MGRKFRNAMAHWVKLPRIYLECYILSVITFFWKCGVRQCGLGKVSTGHKKNLSHFYISKKFWKPCQTFGQLVLAVWSRADWLVLSKVCRNISLSINLLLLKSEQSLLMQVLHTILEYLLLYIAYSECIFLSDGMTNIRYLFWYKF